MKSFLKITLAAVIGCALLSAAPLLAQDQFQGDEVIVQKITPKPDGNGKRTLHLSLDENRIVFEAPLSAKPNWYFYLPPEANSVVQLIIQKQDGKRIFVLKAIGRGKTVGGFVPREWLDDSGFQPNSPVDEARIQKSIKSNPVYILVN